MKTSNTLLLVTLLWTYMRRRVFSQGPMRDPLFRTLIALVSVLTLAALTFFAFVFLEPALAEEAGTLEFLARIASISTVYWTIVAFLFVRVLFGRSSDMMTFTWQLPMTNRQRSAALALFEALVVLGIITLVFVPVAAAVVFLSGFGGLVLIMEGIAMPAFCVFAALSIMNNCLVRVLNTLKLSRIATLFSIILSAALLGAFASSSQSIATAMSEDYLGQKSGFHVTDLFIFIHNLHGGVTALLVFLLVAIVTAVAAWGTVPHTYTTAKKFFRIKFPAAVASTELGWYLMAWLRRSDTWLAIIGAYAVSVVLLINAPENVAYSVGILTTQALYHFSSTRSLRRMPGFVVTPGKTLVMLLSSQAVGLLLVGIPILLLAIVAGSPVLQVILTAGVCISGIVLLNLLGVLFPQDRDNPFSAMVSYLICLLVIATMIVVFGVVNMPTPLNAAVLGVFHAAGLYYSYLGILTVIRKARYA